MNESTHRTPLATGRLPGGISTGNGERGHHSGHEHTHDDDHTHHHDHRAVKFSLLGLGATSLFQLAIVLVSGSVALLADTVHNFSDALTAVPLWVAFLLGRRPATRTYTHGFGRAEDLAGLFIVAMIALSAVIAAVESIHRFFAPQPVQNLGWVMAAGLVGFAGNELVAIYRIRVGRRIGSAALVADGIHARTDGFTSLAVIAGVIGIWLGFPLADPIVGLLISAVISVLLWEQSVTSAAGSWTASIRPLLTNLEQWYISTPLPNPPPGSDGPAINCTPKSESPHRPSLTLLSCPNCPANSNTQRRIPCPTWAQSPSFQCL
jgi:Co/Zn/Cd efflux system component